MTGDAIAAVVVTYESASTIDECLQRLRAAEGVVKIRVVDNGSSDDSVAIIQRHATADRRVRFIANPDNPGFGAACNQGVAAADPDAAGWVALVNPDLMVEPDTLARMLALARDEKATSGHGDRGDGTGWDVGSSPCVLLGADLVGEDGVRDAAARRREPEFASMLRALLSGVSSTSASMAIPPDDRFALQPVQAVSGALMLLPRALYDRLGGFDEGYRLHAEDLDLCRRARQAGAAIAVANPVRVFHARGVSSRSRPVFVEWHKHRGLARYFRKFEAQRRAWPVRILVLAMIWARFPFAALRASSRSRPR
ncbi:MAG: glycosyltransferase family 2 protein [Luteimonas sp.]